MAQSETNKHQPVNILFVGDSIIFGWSNVGADIWRRKLEPLNAKIVAFPGDRVEHCLHRLDQGSCDGIEPKLIVLMIGTNNVIMGGKDTNAAIVDQISTLVDKLLTTKPNAKLLLLSILPKCNDLYCKRIADINSLLAKLDNGTTIRFLDISQAFKTPEGIINEKLYIDMLHLNFYGYEIWYDKMKKPLKKLLQ